MFYANNKQISQSLAELETKKKRIFLNSAWSDLIVGAAHLKFWIFWKLKFTSFIISRLCVCVSLSDLF